MDNAIIIKTSLFYKLIMWIAGFLFLFGTIWSFLYNMGVMIVIPLVLFLLSITGILMSGKAEITDKGFFTKLPMGNYYILWEEVEFIETGAGNLIIGNPNKRLCFPSFEYWAGEDKERALTLIKKILQVNIEIKETMRAILPIFKKTKDV